MTRVGVFLGTIFLGFVLLAIVVHIANFINPSHPPTPWRVKAAATPGCQEMLKLLNEADTAAQYNHTRDPERARKYETILNEIDSTMAEDGCFVPDNEDHRPPMRWSGPSRENTEINAEIRRQLDKQGSSR